MQLPSLTLIFGSGSIASALCRVLNLLCNECYKYQIDAIPNDNAPKDEKAKFKHQLGSSRLVIAIASGGYQFSQILYLVRYLRTNFFWKGGFLVIVQDAAQKQHLIELSLFGERDIRFAYGKVAGHAVVCQPLLLVDLLQAVSTLEEMYSNQWYSLLERSQIKGSLPKQLDEADRCLTQGCITETLEVLCQVQDAMNKINLHLLLSHEDEKLVRTLMEKYSPESYLSANECSVIINTLRQILAKV